MRQRMEPLNINRAILGRSKHLKLSLAVRENGSRQGGFGRRFYVLAELATHELT